MSLCKSCGGSVRWERIDGKPQCFNADTNTIHWDSCSQRRFERIKATGQYFETDDSKGYRTPLKRSGVQLVEQTSGVIPSRTRINPDCQDCVPPWEICPRPCPNTIPA